MPTISVDKNALGILREVKERIKRELKIEGVDYSDVIRYMYSKLEEKEGEPG